MALSSRRRVDIAIVGGGMGGLALAVGLQCRGFDAHVFEASPKLHLDSGSGTVISIRENGRSALDGLRSGLAEALVKSGGLQRRAVSQVYGMEPNSEPLETIESEFQRPVILSSWHAAQMTLASFIDPQRVHLGYYCTGYAAAPEGKGDGVRAFFRVQKGSRAAENGVGPKEADADSVLSEKEALAQAPETVEVEVEAKLVVGADGVRSAVRKCMVGDRPRYICSVNWNALVKDLDTSQMPGGPPPEDHIVALRQAGGPPSPMTGFLFKTAPDTTFWQFRIQDVDGSVSKELESTNFGGFGKLGNKERALNYLLRWPAQARLRAAIEATDAAIIYERFLFDQPPLQSWSDLGGRVVMLGDAVHAMFPGPGEGARTAFEDAHQLALALEEEAPGLEPEAIARAISRYEEARIIRCNRIMQFAAEGSGHPGAKVHSPEGQALSPEEMRERFMEYSKPCFPGQGSRSCAGCRSHIIRPFRGGQISLDVKYFRREDWRWRCRMHAKCLFLQSGCGSIFGARWWL